MGIEKRRTSQVARSRSRCADDHSTALPFTALLSSTLLTQARNRGAAMPSAAAAASTAVPAPGPDEAPRPGLPSVRGANADASADLGSDIGAMPPSHRALEGGVPDSPVERSFKSSNFYVSPIPTFRATEHGHEDGGEGKVAQPDFTRGIPDFASQQYSKK